MINMPVCPAPKAVAWRIEYPESIDNGRPQYITELIAAEEVCSGVLIRIACGSNLPVFAWPVYSCGRTGGFPAAAIYPADISGGKMAVSFEDGFACSILRSCILNSEVIRGFDTLTFREAVSLNAAELVDDNGRPLPGGAWCLDPVPIIARLGYGLFRESSITAAETLEFSIPAAKGIWYSDNPLYNPAETVYKSETDMFELTPVIPVNSKTVFYKDGSDEFIEVFFNDRIWCWSNPVTGASQSGRM
ncbi:MAG: hypothetical protein PQJ61_16410 [Spirochaetales bacterium]|uniref:Uncharacterized protein n=1 Tax=Candidatus Thalassospirochaeta sargassi TaxID=3119039 RepID=A0AAJ1ML07_9SPIO|nr:hypothetical protein [Spirochaetales bacterium]